MKNWLKNSGLPKDTQVKILNLHLNAKENVKKAYDMKVVDGDCLLNTSNVILIGEK